MEEDDIRKWHKKPSAQGQGAKPPGSQDNFKKCWSVGAHMIKQFDEQESEEESEDDSEEDENVRPATTVASLAAKSTQQASVEYDEDDEDEDESE